MSTIKWSFEQLRNERYVLRPNNQLGTCGWIDGKPWQAEFITGLHKAARRVHQLNQTRQPATNETPETVKETSNG